MAATGLVDASGQPAGRRKQHGGQQQPQQGATGSPAPGGGGAITWNQGIWLSASVIGHAMVGFLIAGVGNTLSLSIISLLVLIGFGFMYQLKPKPPLNEPGEKKTLDSVKEGLRFVFSTKEILGALSLDLFLVER